jgi:DNA-binding IscR family transcriptional regulator
VTLGEAIRLMEGPLAPLPCASKTAYRKCDECADDRFCGTRMVMRDVRDEMARILDHTSLADVCRREDQARSDANQSEELMYFI